MGKIDLRPRRVNEHAKLLFRLGRTGAPPPWSQALENIPPSSALVRTQPVQLREPRKTGKARKPSRMFQPQRIAYEEDNLRVDFFGDHPWELARPRLVLENDGKDLERWDWSKPTQSGRPVNGESVVQRQIWLMQHGRSSSNHDPSQPGMTKAQAYDQARKEHYEIRHFDQIEQRVQREEALSTGAFFNIGVNAIGMGLENRTFDIWKEWAKEQVTIAEQAKSAAYTGIGSSGDGSEGSETINDMDDVINSIELDTQEATKPEG